MREPSAEEILEGIREHNNEILKYVYNSFYHQIKFFVLNNSGSEEDAQDIYQESIIIIYRRLIKGSFELKDCSFRTYLNSVCRLLWLRQLAKRRVKATYIAFGEQLAVVEDDIFDEYEKSERYKLYQMHFRLLPQICKQLLELSLRKVPLKEIARIMGFGSEAYAKKRKKKCKETLIMNIKNDPKFKNLYNGYQND